MNNNDIFRRLRYIFQYSDDQMMEVFALMEQTRTRQQVCAWLKQDDSVGFLQISDRNLATFLNGRSVIAASSLDSQPVPQRRLTTSRVTLHPRTATIAMQSEPAVTLPCPNRALQTKH